MEHLYRMFIINGNEAGHWFFDHRAPRELMEVLEADGHSVDYTFNDDEHMEILVNRVVNKETGKEESGIIFVYRGNTINGTDKLRIPLAGSKAKAFRAKEGATV